MTSTETGLRALTNPEKESILDSERKIRKANTQAYIYYAVCDQYGEKMDDSADITWSISSSVSHTVDTSAGRITIQKSKDGDGQAAYIYGEKIRVHGVYQRGTDPIIVDGEVEIGAIQATDKIEAAGFVNEKLEKKERVEELPKKFAKDTWYMVYKTYDQNGHLMEPIKYEDDDINIVPDSESFYKISIPTENVGGKIYNLEDGKYASVKVQPSTQTDRGGEVILTSISKKTGHKEDYKFKIKEAAVLKSIEISGAEKGVIADGDRGVKLAYKALTVDGKETKDYETIVRSSNVLSLAASEGRLEVKENNKGEADITWTDTENNPLDFSLSSAKDGADRRVMLTAVVSGGKGDGETKSSLIYVRDTRRPVAFKSIYWGEENNKATVIGDGQNVDFVSDRVVYVDQYGDELNGRNGSYGVRGRAKAFFDQAMKEGFNKEIYAIKVETDNDTELHIVNNNKYTDDKGEHLSVPRNKDGKSEYQIINWQGGVNSAAEDKDLSNRIVGNKAASFTAHDKYDKDKDYDTNKTKTLEYNKLVDNVSVTYSIVSVKETEVSGGVLQTGKDFTRVGNGFTDDYSVVPTTAIRDNVSIELDNTKGKYFVYTDNTNYANGTYIKDIVENTGKGLTGEVTNDEKTGALKIGGSSVYLPNPDNPEDKTNIVISNPNLGVKVYGTTRSGLKCELPKDFYRVDYERSDIDLENKDTISAVTGGALTWNQLYNDNDARMQRITATKTLAIKVKTTKVNDGKENASENDSEKYLENVVTKKISLSDEIPYPASTDYNPVPGVNYTTLRYNKADDAKVFDQYGETMINNCLNFTYSAELTKENADEDKAHLLNSFTKYGDGTQSFYASGVEIGDEFNMTLDVRYNKTGYTGLGFTTNPYKLTAPADDAACILSEDIYQMYEFDNVDNASYFVTGFNKFILDSNDKKQTETSMNSDKNWREADLVEGGLGMKY